MSEHARRQASIRRARLLRPARDGMLERGLKPFRRSIMGTAAALADIGGGVTATCPRGLAISESIETIGDRVARLRRSRNVVLAFLCISRRHAPACATSARGPALPHIMLGWQAMTASRQGMTTRLVITCYEQRATQDPADCKQPAGGCASTRVYEGSTARPTQTRAWG